VRALVEELRDPKYGDYYLYFSNVVKKSALEQVAEADDHEVIKQVMVSVITITATNWRNSLPIILR
jgi:hypothetical protein